MLFIIVLTLKLSAYVSMTVMILYRLLRPWLRSEILLNFTQNG